MEEKSNLYIVAIVGIIAVVALVVLVMNIGARQSFVTLPTSAVSAGDTASGDSAGQVTKVANKVATNIGITKKNLVSGEDMYCKCCWSDGNCYNARNECGTGTSQICSPDRDNPAIQVS